MHGHHHIAVIGVWIMRKRHLRHVLYFNSKDIFRLALVQDSVLCHFKDNAINEERLVAKVSVFIELTDRNSEGQRAIQVYFRSHLFNFLSYSPVIYPLDI